MKIIKEDEDENEEIKEEDETEEDEENDEEEDEAETIKEDEEVENKPRKETKATKLNTAKPKQNPFENRKPEQTNENQQLINLLNSLPLYYYKESKEITINGETFYLLFEARGLPFMLLKQIE